MATQAPTKIGLLHLNEIIVRDIPDLKYKLLLFVGSEAIELQRKDNRTWTPVQRPDISPTSQVRVEILMKSGHLPWARKDQNVKEIDLQTLFNEYWTSKKHELTLLEGIVVGKYRCNFEFNFSASPMAEHIHSLLKELEELLSTEHSPMMDARTERVVDKVIKYGSVFAELNPVAKAVFGLASVTFELLKEQNKYDQMPSVLLDRLQRILPLGRKVADDIVCEETEILEKVVQRMFDVMRRVAEFSCNYVKARSAGGSANPEKIEEMDKELTKVIEDFNYAVDVEALRLAKKNEQELLLTRLKRVDAGYDLKLRCMEGTRETLLNQTMAWAANGLETSHLYWIHGLPGIGKTSLAHSICERLHNNQRLAGAFFCKRDDADMSDLRNILPTLISKLAEIFPPFRSIVADRLRSDPNLTSRSMKDSLFLDFVVNLPRHPKHTLVFVIDALDECGDNRDRPVVTVRRSVDRVRCNLSSRLGLNLGTLNSVPRMYTYTR